MLLLSSASALCAVLGPVIDANFPDPAMIQVNGTAYAYATNSGNINVQVAVSHDSGATWNLTGTDALPDVGSWATNGSTWAPDVVQRADGTFILYYAAENPDINTHCVAAATSMNPEGPFTPQSNPITCQASGGGTIDIAGFQDTDGTRYVVYKVDGSSLGGGGPCGNANGAFATPIMLQKLEADGLTPTGNPVEILDRIASEDGPLVEAPVLIIHGGTYVLFYSSHCFNDPGYDIRYATAANISGPYTRQGSIIATGDYNLTSPGGATPLPDGSFMVFHAQINADPLTRAMYTATLTWNGTSISVA
ncbi:glycoside hydrolase family 43 protein [Coniophora puteana RWD-64-598 SS2]|uniref:Glycoside hydrolase family 43 protein n=1 Tax=Coniophora puteana (strain RWD-64-598) TaxID=741705 RepID=A0A5M3MEX4_CONPW|nr:glycoside hydrolase family 43 protein [Coniophora puteana RWD-64-598 SS2]EIW77470.1 glycoside hydrolase family 43 protein [Coniophora puteana RWD-64-598 SS2]